MAAGKTPLVATFPRHCLQSCSAGRVQVCSADDRTDSPGSASGSWAPCASAWDLLLDVSGNELSVRSLSRGGSRSHVRRVRTVYGVLSGDDLGSGLPHA